MTEAARVPPTPPYEAVVHHARKVCQAAQQREEADGEFYVPSGTLGQLDGALAAYDLALKASEGASPTLREALQVIADNAHTWERDAIKNVAVGALGRAGGDR